LATVKRIERTPGRVYANPVTQTAIARAFESAGVVFLEEDDGHGVKLRKVRPQSVPAANSSTPPKINLAELAESPKLAASA
jgi:hypothetical protein